MATSDADVLGNDRHASAGWALGGGVEYAFTNNWTAKIEGLYVDIDRGNKLRWRPAAASTRPSSGTDFGVVRAGLNYKF